MTAQKNLKPYKPDYSPEPNLGDGHLPNESTIPPQPDNPSERIFDVPVRLGRKTEDPDHASGDEGRSDLRSKRQHATALHPPLTPTEPIEENIVVATKGSHPLALILSLLLVLATGASVYSYSELQPKVRSLAIARDLSKPAQDLAISFSKIEDGLSNLISIITKSSAHSEDEPALPLLLKETSGIIKEEIRVAEKNLLLLTDRSPANYPNGIKEIVEETDIVSRNSGRLLSEVKSAADHYGEISGAKMEPNFQSENDLLRKTQAQSQRLAQLSAKIAAFRQNHQFLFFR